MYLSSGTDNFQMTKILFYVVIQLQWRDIIYTQTSIIDKCNYFNQLIPQYLL